MPALISGLELSRQFGSDLGQRVVRVNQAGHGRRLPTVSPKEGQDLTTMRVQAECVGRLIEPVVVQMIKQ